MPAPSSSRTRARSSSPKTAAKPRPSQSELTINGRRIPVSNLDKILYPSAGFTKGQVIDYYIRIAPVLLPHLKDRPLTLKRYPNGVTAPFFYEKRCPSHRPSWVKTAPVWSEHNRENINFCVVNDVETLVWAANLADLELHTYLGKTKNFNRPTAIVFDLDPGPPAHILDCAKVALLLRQLLIQHQLQSFPKTSGSKGLQLYVPLNTNTTYDLTKSFAKNLALALEREHSDLVLSNMAKRLRTGKVFVDWSQNDSHKTTVCVYSLRAKERPTVSTPVHWNELEQALAADDPAQLSFTSDQVLARVDQFGDLFAPVQSLKQRLPNGDLKSEI